MEKRTNQNLDSVLFFPTKKSPKLPIKSKN